MAKLKLPRSNLGGRYARLVDKCDDAERKLVRAFNAWRKYQTLLRATGRRIDEEHQDDMQRQIEALAANTKKGVK